MKQNTPLVSALGALAVFWAVDVSAQSSAQAPIELGRPAPTTNSDVASLQAPEWLVWQVFHDSLRYYHGQSPDAVSELLKNRIEIEEEEADLFLDSGARYLQELSRIDADARASMQARYQAKVPQPQQEFLSQAMRSQGAQSLAAPVIAHTADGRQLYDALVADGLIAQVEQQKRAVLQSHVQELRRTIGVDKVAKVEEWVHADVAGRVMYGRPLAPAQPPVRPEPTSKPQIPREQP